MTCRCGLTTAYVLSRISFCQFSLARPRERICESGVCVSCVALGSLRVVGSMWSYDPPTSWVGCVGLVGVAVLCVCLVWGCFGCYFP